MRGLREVMGLGEATRGLEGWLRGPGEGICACVCVGEVLVGARESVNEEEDEDKEGNDEGKAEAGKDESEGERNEAEPASLPSLRPSFPSASSLLSLPSSPSSSSPLTPTKGLGVGNSFPFSEEPLTGRLFSMTAEGGTTLSRLPALPCATLSPAAVGGGRTAAGETGEGTGEATGGVGEESTCGSSCSGGRGRIVVFPVTFSPLSCS